MFDHMIRWPEEVVQSQESGRVVSRFVNEASQALSGASQVLTVLVRDSLQVAALLCVLFWHNWQLTLVKNRDADQSNRSPNCHQTVFLIET